MDTTNEKIAEEIDRSMKDAIKEACARLRFTSGVEQKEIETLEELSLVMLGAAIGSIIENCERLRIAPERGVMVFIESVAGWNKKIDENADKRRRGGSN